MKSRAMAKLKRIRALELVTEGHSYDQIARRVGFSHRGSAYRAVHRALAERQVDAVDELRYIETARLDAMQSALWDGVTSGDVKSIQAVLRIIDQRCRLLGLYEVAVAPDADNYLVHPSEGNTGEATTAVSPR